MQISIKSFTFIVSENNNLNSTSRSKLHDSPYKTIFQIPPKKEHLNLIHSSGIIPEPTVIHIFFFTFFFLFMFAIKRCSQDYDADDLKDFEETILQGVDYDKNGKIDRKELTMILLTLAKMPSNEH